MGKENKLVVFYYLDDTLDGFIKLMNQVETIDLLILETLIK